MATSKVELCNTALALLGADLIKSLDEQNKNAHFCLSVFDRIRKQVLMPFDWPFARRINKLTEQLEAPNMPVGASSFLKPAGCLIPRDIYPFASNKRKWGVVGPYIYIESTIGDEYLLYTYNEENVSNFSEPFNSVFVYALAIALCMPLTRNKDLRKELKSDFGFQLEMAYEIESNIGSDFRPENFDPNTDLFNKPTGTISNEDPYFIELRS